MKQWLMPRDFFQYLVEVRRVFVTAELVGGFEETIRLCFIHFRTWLRLFIASCCHCERTPLNAQRSLTKGAESVTPIPVPVAER